VVANFTVCFTSPARVVGQHFRIRDHSVRLVGNHGDVEGSFVVRLIERRESAACVGRFELRRRVLAAVFVFAEIESAQFVVQDSGVLDVHTRWPGLNRLVETRVAISFSLSSVTFAVWVVPPLETVASWNSISQ